MAKFSACKAGRGGGLISTCATGRGGAVFAGGAAAGIAGLLCWTEAVAGRTGVVVAVGTGICAGALGASTDLLGAVAGTVIRCPCVRPCPLFAAL